MATPTAGTRTSRGAQAPESPTIIPIAGGKGGVGKTLFTANLGLALAGMGCPTVVADLDLGNSNLHTLLGLPNRFPGIGDFLRVGAGGLAEYLVETEVPHLRFLAGDGRMPFMANITHAQKTRLLSNLRTLPAQYVILDLGAGCAFHTIDFFSMVDAGMVLSSPEYPAVMSALVFLKNMLLRRIERSLSHDPELTEVLNRLYVQPVDAPQMTVQSLVALASEVNPDAGKCIQEVCARCRPRLVINLGDTPDDLAMLDSIDRTIRQILSIEVEYFGFIVSDPAVRDSIRHGKALLTAHPDSPAARSIAHIARRVTRFWDSPIPNSAELLRAHTRKEFAEKKNRVQGAP
jgi:flagellar biosynthesis protein FlhG